MKRDVSIHRYWAEHLVPFFREKSSALATSLFLCRFPTSAFQDSVGKIGWGHCLGRGRASPPPLWQRCCTVTEPTAPSPRTFQTFFSVLCPSIISFGTRLLGKLLRDTNNKHEKVLVPGAAVLFLHPPLRWHVFRAQAVDHGASLWEEERSGLSSFFPRFSFAFRLHQISEWLESRQKTSRGSGGANDAVEHVACAGKVQVGPGLQVAVTCRGPRPCLSFFLLPGCFQPTKIRPETKQHPITNEQSNRNKATLFLFSFSHLSLFLPGSCVDLHPSGPDQTRRRWASVGFWRCNFSPVLQLCLWT